MRPRRIVLINIKLYNAHAIVSLVSEKKKRKNHLVNKVIKKINLVKKD